MKIKKNVTKSCYRVKNGRDVASETFNKDHFSATEDWKLGNTVAYTPLAAIAIRRQIEA
jgi:hypothetical protein